MAVYVLDKRQQPLHGFQTGDHVKAIIPKGAKSGFFNLQTGKSTTRGIRWKHCYLIQRSNGYRYEGIYTLLFTKLTTNKRSTLPPGAKRRGIRVSVR